MPQRELAIASDGTVDPVPDAAYAVAADGIELAGEPVAQARQRNTAHQALVLWRLDGPLRLRSRRTGVFGNGDVYGAGRLTVWDCRQGRLLLTVLGKAGKPIQIVQNERLVRTVDVPNGGSQFVAVPVDGRPLVRGPVHLRRQERRDLRHDAVPLRALGLPAAAASSQRSSYSLRSGSSASARARPSACSASSSSRSVEMNRPRIRSSASSRVTLARWTSRSTGRGSRPALRRAPR